MVLLIDSTSGVPWTCTMSYTSQTTIGKKPFYGKLSQLHEICQKKEWDNPAYSTTKEGVDHDPLFHASVNVGGLTFRTTHSSPTSKLAQQDAARLAIEYFAADPARLAVDYRADPFSATMYKGKLHMLCQSQGWARPEYCHGREGPDHKPQFTNGRSFTTVVSYGTLKQAKQEAARLAWQQFAAPAEKIIID